MATYSATVLATANLSAYWRLGESVGPTAADTSGAGLTMTYTGSPTLGVTGMLTGDANTCMDTNGSSQYAIRTTHASLQGGTAISLECWVNGDSTGAKCPVGFFGSGTDKGYWINFNTNIEFWASLNGSSQTGCASPTATVTGTTYHVVGTFDGANMRLYVNGVLKNTTALAGTIWTVATANSFAIGRLGALSSDYFDGRVDEVAIYQRALTLSEVLSHYTAGITAPASFSAVPYKAQGPRDATIALPGWGDQRLIPITPPSMSWRTDGPGSFECTVDNRMLMKHGLKVIGTTSPLKGRWLWWEHPTAGAWGGVITATDSGKWQTRITAEQFAVLLRKRRTNVNYGSMSMSPGSLALIFMTGAERNGDSYMLTSWTAEECGSALEMQPRGGDLCDDILPQLAAFGYQWRVKATTMTERAFEFRSRVGSDKRGSVLLSDGRHIVDVNSTGDLWTVANSIVGVAGDSDFQTANGYQLDDDRAIRTMGRRYEATVAYTGVVTRSTIVPLVKKDLYDRRFPREVYTADVVDEDSIWSQFREGDIISIASASLNYQGPMDVDMRSLDMSNSVLTIAGKLRWQEAT